MLLTKPMLRVFKAIIHGHNTLERIAGSIKKSGNWVSGIATKLEKEGFVIKEKRFRLKKSRLSIRIAGTPYAIKLKDLMYQYKTIDFSGILSCVRIKFLASLCLDWKDIKTVSSQAEVSPATLRIYMKPLLNRGIIKKKDNMYKINRKAWPVLYEFLKDYRNFSLLNGTVRWKYLDEIILEIGSENLKRGVYTGFFRYAEYGIRINIVKALCYVPERALSKEEIFVHSLFEIEDPRTLYLAMAFFAKNKLNKKKVMGIAIKYGLYTKFNEFLDLLESKRKKPNALPAFDISGFIRVAKMYGVRNV